VLGHRPDEFGLVPDREGFVAYKELLQALHEEEAWRYVRQSHINEILLGDERTLFQSENKRIRSTDPRWRLDLHHPVISLPKILFTAIRQKAHPVVMEKGLKGTGDRLLIGTGDRLLILSPVRDMALRIGRRRDQKPVVLEILAERAAEKGTVFYGFEDLLLSPEIPSRFIAGPPVPKDVLERIREKGPSPLKDPMARRPVLTPGTFILDPSRDPDPHRKAKGKKRKGWKEAARKIRRGNP